MPRNRAFDDAAKWHLKTPPHLSTYKQLHSWLALQKQQELQREEDEIVAMAANGPPFPLWLRNPNAELKLLSPGSGCPLQAGTGHGRPGRAPGRC